MLDEEVVSFTTISWRNACFENDEDKVGLTRVAAGLCIVAGGGRAVAPRGLPLMSSLRGSEVALVHTLQCADRGGECALQSSSTCSHPVLTSAATDESAGARGSCWH